MYIKRGFTLKILLSADVHVEHSFIDGGNKNERESALVLDVITEIIKKEKPDHFIIAGDFFDAFGKITASLAVNVKKYVFSWIKLGTKVHFIAGNHDYEKVEEKFFGKSLVSALFSGLEDFGITVSDIEPRKILLNNESNNKFEINLIAIPYRETLEQWQGTCQEKINDFFEYSKNNKCINIPCWHVGLPFGDEAWRGDENENGWIRSGNADVDKMLATSFNGKVYCGHYHGPGFTACEIVSKETLEDLQKIRFDNYLKSKNGFMYIGSPATRSRSEHNQNKRLMLLEIDEETGNSIEMEISTNLMLDYVAEDLDKAKKHLNNLSNLFGDKVFDIARVSIILPDEASLNDYHIIRELSSKVRGNINVEKPRVNKKGKIEDIRDKFISDSSYVRTKMELDIARHALFDFYKIPFKNKLLARLIAKVGTDLFESINEENKEEVKELIFTKLKYIYLDLLDRGLDGRDSKIADIASIRNIVSEQLDIYADILNSSNVKYNDVFFESEFSEDDFVSTELNDIINSGNVESSLIEKIEDSEFIDFFVLDEVNSKNIDALCRYIRTRIILEQISTVN